MFAKVPCPAAEDLASWARGEAPRDQARGIGEHVENCFECARMLAAIRTSADLTEVGAETGNVPVFWSARQREELHAKLVPVTTSSVDATIVPRAMLDLTTLLAPPKDADELGRLGRYRVLELVGKGAASVVFRADDPARQRTVALKAMLPRFAAYPLAKDHFQRAVREAKALQHDHIAPIHELADERGVPYLTMPFLEGITLETYCNQQAGPLPVDEVIDIGRQLSSALAAAHALGITHRELKPANIWLDHAPTGNGRALQVLDFGLMATTDDLALPVTDPALGAPAYRAPEQARGERGDSRADLFSLGAILYELATGRRPFHGPDVKSILAAVATGTPPPPAAINPDLPADLSELILELLDKNPVRRPALAQEVNARLAAIKERLDDERRAQAEAARQPPPLPPPLPQAPRRPWYTWMQISLHLWVVLYLVNGQLELDAFIELPSFPGPLEWFFKHFSLAVLGQLCFVAILLMEELYADFTGRPPRRRAGRERPWVLANLGFLMVLYFANHWLGMDFEVNEQVVSERWAPVIKAWYLPILGQLLVLFGLVCYWLYLLFWTDEPAPLRSDEFQQTLR